MKFSEVELPSNRKFGLFFAAVFAAVFVFLLYKNIQLFAWTSALLSFVFAGFAFAKPDLLLPLNRLWMCFGFLLGKIVSPIVTGVIFYLVFTPVGVLTRMFGRDELRLKPVQSASYWREREPNQPEADSFKRQF